MPRRYSGGDETVLSCAVAVAACGGSDANESAPSSTAGAAVSGAAAPVRDKVPAAIRNTATLTVATDAPYPPNESIGADGKTVEGMDPDLAKAIAAVMGLKADVKNATFDSIIP